MFDYEENNTASTENKKNRNTQNNKLLNWNIETLQGSQ